jgi:hypothetical protein
MDRPSARCGRAPRRGEEGVVLVFALFVILILLVIVPQFRFSASVEREIAFNEVEELQMESLARAAILRARSALLVDLDEDGSEGEALGADQGASAGAGGAPADQGAGAAGAAAGGSAGAGGAGGGAAGAHVDSLDEVWANGEFTITLGEEAGFKTRIVVSDEDAKLNLLLLFSDDEEYRREWRPRFERCLDLMRDGEPDDLSISDASDLVDRIEKWMQGDRKSEELSTPPLAQGDWHKLLHRAVHAPLSLAELCLAGGIPPRLLHGFGVEDGDERRWILGLSQTLTVWSNLEYVDPTPNAGQPPQNPDSGPENRARSEAPGVNNGRVNVNTAPLCVLKSLFSDDEVPYSSWDRYEEFRREQLEELKKQREELSGASDEEKSDPNLDDEDVAAYPLKTLDDLRKVEGFSPDSSSLTPERWNKLASLLSVESNVFTITVMIGTHALPRRYYVARSVVWRREHGQDSRCLPIVPFEHVPLSAVDMGDFAKELEEWSESYSGDS